MRRLALPVVVAVVAALVSVAASAEGTGAESAGADGAGAAGVAEPAAAFTETEYSVPLLGRMFGRDEAPGRNANMLGARDAAVPSNQYSYFGELEMEQRDGTDLDLTFKIEGRPDASHYRYCKMDWDTCQNTEVRVLPDEGLLYFWNSAGTTDQTHWPAAFATQRLEVSAADAGTGLKVYREVVVNPPPEAKGCDDYGDDNVDAYVCLYLRELIPEGAGGSNEETLRAGLPGLVQNASNYSLVFAEEFDGSPPAANAAGCKDGLSTLDESMWNYGDPCAMVDSEGESCGNIADDSLTMAVAKNCIANLDTYGKLHYKYGYLEFKYTVNMDAGSPFYHNINFIAWPIHNSRRDLWKQYGVEVNDLENYLKYGDVELDFYEYAPNARHSTFIWHANWNHAASREVSAWRSVKWLEHCWPQDNPVRQFLMRTSVCSTIDTHTVTSGVEWTPRGYRTFTKVDGYQDELTVWSEDKMEIYTIDSRGRWVGFGGSQLDQFIEYTDPDDASTLLEQVGVAHTPNPLSFGSWAWPSAANFERIHTRVNFDYVRLWQPKNHYADMEPVYQ